MPPLRDASGDATMTALVAQQMAAVFTTLATQLNQFSTNQGNNPLSCNFERSNYCHSPPAPKPNNRKRKDKNYAIVTPAIATNQVVSSGQTNKKTYTGNLPLCTNCQYHHPQNVSCRHCTNCGNFGHTQSYCHVQKKAISTQPPEEVKAGPSRPGKKRKRQNFAVVTPTTPKNQVAPEGKEKKGYTGTHPPCNTCCFHHPPAAPCRFCSICGRYGHTPPYCKTTPQPNQPKQPNPIAIAPPNQAQGGACFECGDPNHYRNQCPKLIIVNQGARGRAFNINTQDAQANNDEL